VEGKRRKVEGGGEELEEAFGDFGEAGVGIVEVESGMASVGHEPAVVAGELEDEFVAFDGDVGDVQGRGEEAYLSEGEEVLDGQGQGSEAVAPVGGETGEDVWGGDGGELAEELDAESFVFDERRRDGGGRQGGYDQVIEGSGGGMPALAKDKTVESGKGESKAESNPAAAASLGSMILVKAKRDNAREDAFTAQLALMKYRLEYTVWPNFAKGQQKRHFTDEVFMETMFPPDGGKAPSENPKRIRFLEGGLENGGGQFLRSGTRSRRSRCRGKFSPPGLARTVIAGRCVCVAVA
jgi:hypothetical protein